MITQTPRMLKAQEEMDSGIGADQTSVVRLAATWRFYIAVEVKSRHVAFESGPDSDEYARELERLEALDTVVFDAHTRGDWRSIKPMANIRGAFKQELERRQSERSRNETITENPPYPAPASTRYPNVCRRGWVGKPTLTCDGRLFSRCGKTIHVGWERFYRESYAMSEIFELM
ncbi:hypothetical protein A1O3_00314 [Capronia epimyces CBS 606.96]|uniref:Uncharacterized protein n=1 Tax=Capronia epimyces CBS 606.96 TaxID=1182542 RepID=W9ZB50_9EURO|nr:uncharacterized protein A1O3_00314 [Capronia epimyces CBS 606.96]EXJ91764.1 hypothetical protein A1O3_00314 [Capronia epimyces CBS 606.96]